MAPPPERLRDGATPGSTQILPRNAYKFRPGAGRRRGSSWWLFFLIVFCVVPVVAISYQLGIIWAAIGANDPRVDRPATVPTNGYTVLLVGVDDRGDGRTDGIRSDTLILARVNPTTGAIGLLSIPRDTRVEVRGRGTIRKNCMPTTSANKNPEWHSLPKQSSGLPIWAARVHALITPCKSTSRDLQI